jgi:hypothetical protein
MTFDLRRIVAVLGIGTLLLGTFSPMIYGPSNLEIKTFWSWGGGWFWDGDFDGNIIVMMTSLAVFLVWKHRYRWLLLIGAISLFLIRGAYVEFHEIRNASLSHGAEFAASAQQMGLSWGLWVMVIGAVLLILASLFPAPRGSNDNARPCVKKVSGTFYAQHPTRAVKGS